MAIQSNFPAIKPSLLLDFANTKQLDPRITFTRATTATYYDGVTTAKAEENLFTRSQEFDSADWSKTATTVTANATTAPDGTSTADQMIETADTSNHRVQQGMNAINGLTYTFSVFAKKGVLASARNFIQLAVPTTPFGANAYANFDILNGTIPTQGAGLVSAAITNVGSGWYRCSIVATATSTIAANFWLQIAQSGTDAILPSYAGSTSADVLLWGAQAEQRSSVTAYTATTTQAITNYIPVLQTAASGVARFDNNPTTGESLGLLIEEQRTNICLYSSDLSNAAWTKTNATITADTVVAPDGTLTGDKLVENTATSTHSTYSRPSITNGTTYALSFYIKPSGRNRVTVQQFNSSSAYAGTTLDVLTGSVVTTTGTGASASVTSVGNGWYRCVLVGVANETATSYMQISLAQDSHSSAGPQTYTGDGFSGVFVWGAQVEAGAFATSYIPTVASTVTRNADAASMTGTNFSSWFNNNEFTLYAEAENRNGIISSTNYHFATISDGTSANSQLIRIEGADNRPSTFGSYNGSANQWLLYGTAVAKGSFAKLALAYAFNNVGFSSNAGTVGTDTVAQIPSQNVLNIGANSTNAQQICGCIKKIAYYPLRVTNAQLQALTS